MPRNSRRWQKRLQRLSKKDIISVEKWKLPNCVRPLPQIFSEDCKFFKWKQKGPWTFRKTLCFVGSFFVWELFYKWPQEGAARPLPCSECRILSSSWAWRFGRSYACLWNLDEIDAKKLVWGTREQAIKLLLFKTDFEARKVCSPWTVWLNRTFLI